MEPFDLKLFVYQCARRLHIVCLGALLGLILIGGGYTVSQVVLADPMPFQVVDKYYVEYGVDPQIQLSYSYFAGFTWNDWITGDEWVEPVLERLSFPMTKEELVQAVSAELKSDVRILYLTVWHEDRDKALEIAETYRESMYAFGESQKELVKIRLMDTEGPERGVRDVRVFNACVLGVIVGAFFTWFFRGLFFLLDEKVYLPEHFTERYGIPAAGYLGRNMRRATDTKFDAGKQPSCLEELTVNLNYLLGDAQRIGLTAVDASQDLSALEKLLVGKLPKREYTCISGLLQAPGEAEKLREMDANVLVVRAGEDKGGAIKALLHQAKLQDVTFAAAVLIDVDEKLIAFYRFSVWKR